MTLIWADRLSRATIGQAIMLQLSPCAMANVGAKRGVALLRLSAAFSAAFLKGLCVIQMLLCVLLLSPVQAALGSFDLKIAQSSPICWCVSQTNFLVL